jgi:NAD(P)-dependent dehydrogenase (short-subunit alcohol dehydrogenase family)
MQRPNQPPEATAPIPFDHADVATVLRVLEALAEDRALLAHIPAETRRALLVAAGRVSRPERHETVRLAKALRRQDRLAARERDRALVEASGMRTLRKAPVFRPDLARPPEENETPPAELAEARSCYVCKAPFRKLHHFYDQMCPECAALNWEKRNQSADMTGRTALVTGARVKIGYQISLKLLRAGARVIATTRFPHDAALRYSREPDYGAFRDRLCIYGLDLRHSPSVELFAQHLLRTEARLDALINNAAQTVRRPPGWYAHLLAGEETPTAALPPEVRSTLAAYEELVASLRGAGPAALPAADGLASGGLVAFRGALPGVGLRDPARLSQLRYADEDFDREQRAVFPEGRYDADLQQVDLRDINSWRLTLAEVATPEMLEVHLVNAVAPFILCARLKPLMLRTPNRDKHIVNVSAIEGQFYRSKKTDKHPHTNMAKAALNMLVRTSAPDYVRDGIHMNAVDTGWVTDEDPAAISLRKRAEHDFTPPLDIVDGAARVLDPLFHGLNTGEHVWGQFLKDYKPAAW